MNKNEYLAWYKESIAEPEKFWSQRATECITWDAPWQNVVSGTFQEGNVRWFNGAKINAAYNCLDRHLKTKGNQPAILWEGDDPALSQSLTYTELTEQVCRFANVLKTFGVQQGEVVCIYLPMIPEAVIAMLACARIGAVHSVVFAGFSAEALAARLQDANCRIVITANESVRGNQHLPLKKIVDTALEQYPNVENVIVVKRTTTSIDVLNLVRDHWYHDVMSDAASYCAPVCMDANDRLFMLYTSGSTGKPKGIVHGHGGYLVYAALTFKTIFDYQPSDIYWCTADVGWITGHTYGVYGPLLNGATIVLYEGTPVHPTPSRFWNIVDKYHVSIFYTAPTAIRALRREGDKWVQQTSRESLRVLGTVGEPIDPSAWHWYHDMVGRNECPIVDTWWQTETGGIMISPLPFFTNQKAGAASWPFFGVMPKILDADGREVPPNEMGQLVITKPWPGMMQTIHQDQARFMETYFTTFPNCYLTGDEAHRDGDDDFWIHGRSDDVIKVSGHRIGTEEVESAFIKHEAVAEAAVVGVADSIKGQAIYAFIVLQKGITPNEELRKALIQQVRQGIGAIATPRYVQFVENLPKTRSGKIMRRLLRKIANGEDANFGDLSTLTDSAIIESLIHDRITSD